MGRPWKATPEEEKLHGPWSDFAAWQRWMSSHDLDEVTDLGSPADAHLYGHMCFLADGDHVHANPTNKTHTFRPETIEDIINTVPPDRYAAACADLLRAAEATRDGLDKMEDACHEAGVGVKKLQARFFGPIEWVDDGAGGGEIRLRSPTFGAPPPPDSEEGGAS